MRKPHLSLVVVLVLLLVLVRQPSAAAALTAPPLPPVATATGSAATFDTFFLMPDPVNNTQKGSVTAVDPAGGVHVAFSAQTSAGGSRPAYYATCPSGCGNAANWTVIAVGELGFYGTGTTLALDAQGRPRMMWFSQSMSGTIGLPGDGTYHYAACDANCTTPANWKVSPALATDSLGPWNVHYFALDGQGGAGFVYLDDAPRYVTCKQGDCTQAANWQDVALDVAGTKLYDMRLTYTPQGQPRLLSYQPDGPTDLLVFSACDTGCNDMDNWWGVGLWDLHYGRDFTLRLDSQGRPRVALYDEGALHYLWSNGDPLDVGSWSYTTLSTTERFGESVALAFDGADRPHMAAYVGDAYGLAYGACTANCESGSPTWDFEMVETADDLNTLAPVPVTPGCSLSSWMYVGHTPSLALDAGGNPRISYYSNHMQGGTCDVYDDIELMRFATSGSGGWVGPGPNPSYPYAVYIPLALR